MTIVIPPKTNYDTHLYQARHLIENFFAKLKHNEALSAFWENLSRLGETA